MSVCACLYPLIFVDDRDEDNIKYISIPEEVLEEEGGLDNPEFEKVTEEGFDGELHEYMAVIWKEPKNAHTKKYDVNEHIVVAGCDAKVDNNGKKIACRKKEMYMVLHPWKEWNDHHIVKIR